jgi:hypothetical protein
MGAQPSLVALDNAMTLDFPRAPSVSVESIAENLARLDPALESSLREFLEAMRRKDAFAERAWVPATGGLPSIHDEILVASLPSHCRSEKHGTFLRQVVVRETTETRIVYHFDVDLLKEIEASPLDFSYLVVHEWLWDHASDAGTIRTLNAYLHSPQILAATPEDFRQTLFRLGFRFGLNRLRPSRSATLTIFDAPSAKGGIEWEPKVFRSTGEERLTLRVVNASTFEIKLGGSQLAQNLSIVPSEDPSLPSEAFVVLNKSSSLIFWGVDGLGEVHPNQSKGPAFVRFD